MIQRIIPEAGLLTVVAAGEFSLKDAQRSFVRVIHAVMEHKIEKILFDGRDITGELDPIERLSYGEFVARMCQRFFYKRQPVPRFAYVLEEPVLDPLRFGEKVATVGGMSVKAFDNLDDAHEWLGHHATGCRWHPPLH